METSAAITRASGSNLALAFILLPKARRRGMAGLYAFCREVDDVADEDARPVDERARALQAWREDVRTACQGGEPRFPVNRELQPVIRQYALPFALFDELIRGCEMDLTRHRYPTHAELDDYCYRVASVVGLLSIEIFGYTDPRCREYAISLGRALQLTNILRDVPTDARRGRIYLPAEELQRHRVDESEILEGRYSDRYARVAEAVAVRARHFYSLARETLPAADRRSMVAAELMGSVYWRLLRKLESARFNVFGASPTRLSRWQKARLILRTWLRIRAGVMAPNYGTP
ncbi:MAG: presqualene diphosphate synthase HpnD [Verrucomicrobiae bacterium]|nr:presqualene diphosphate synthase HpnD [Verrucomicrobiae bacterium]